MVLHANVRVSINVCVRMYGCIRMCVCVCGHLELRVCIHVSPYVSLTI